MGLFKRRESLIDQAMGGADRWWTALVLAGVCLLFGAFGDEGREVFKYDRLAIGDGEYWRLLTAHFVHLGSTHLVLNLAGLLLVWLLVGRYYSGLQWLAVLAGSVIAISGGFWFIDTYMLWYVGLSGVLHGLLVAGAIRGFRALPSESAIILAIVTGKLAWEQLSGPLPGSESVSGGDVVVNAHLFGAIGGAVAGVLLWRSAGGKGSI
jgi:rhomboid family GlyGly-CTERM serine protease